MAEYVMGDRLERDFAEYLKPRMGVVNSALAILIPTQTLSHVSATSSPVATPSAPPKKLVDRKAN
jgi:hypothetical protein